MKLRVGMNSEFPGPMTPNLRNSAQYHLQRRHGGESPDFIPRLAKRFIAKRESKPLANGKNRTLNLPMHKEVRPRARTLMLLAIAAISVWSSGCSSLNSPSRDKPYWEVSSEDQSSAPVEVFENILYWSVYGAGSALAH
jgi:hypothetical protein